MKMTLMLSQFGRTLDKFQPMFSPRLVAKGIPICMRESVASGSQSPPSKLSCARQRSEQTDLTTSCQLAPAVAGTSKCPSALRRAPFLDRNSCRSGSSKRCLNPPTVLGLRWCNHMQVGKGRPHPLPQTLLGNKKQRHRIPAFTYGILRLAHKRRMGKLYELILYCHHSRSKAFLLFLMLENSWLFCTCIEDRLMGDHLGMAWAWLLGCCTCKFQYCSAVTR